MEAHIVHDAETKAKYGNATTMIEITGIAFIVWMLSHTGRGESSNAVFAVIAMRSMLVIAFANIGMISGFLNPRFISLSGCLGSLSLYVHLIHGPVMQMCMCFIPGYGYAMMWIAVAVSIVT